MGNTEKVLGILLLVLVGGIVAAFVVQAAIDEDYLFQTSEAAYRTDPQRRGLLVARQMLPSLAELDLEAVGETEAIRGNDLTAALADDAKALLDFGVQWVYRRQYGPKDKQQPAFSIMICDAATPAQALGLCRARRPHQWEPLQAGRDGWLSREFSVAGFWKGRYYSELRALLPAGDDLATLSAAAKVVATMQLDYGRPLRAEGLPPLADRVPAPVTDPRADNPFPGPGLDDWQAPDKVGRFTPDNLYVKINGRADAYLQFNVVGLTFGTYFHQSDSQRTIDVYWYDMGKPVNAFGMYRAEAPPDASPVDFGRDGYQVGGAVFFWKGGSYVQVMPAGFDQDDAPVALEIARRISGRIEDSGEGMWALAVLPEAGRMAGSLAYLATDAFGLDFLNEVFTAEYAVPGGRITLFVHRTDTEASARALLEQYTAFLEKYGQVVWKEPHAPPRFVAGEVSGLTDVVFAKGVYLGGVAGADDVEVARRAATGFYEALAVPSE